MKIGEIEFGIPVPPQEGKWLTHFKKMKPGDSFQVECEEGELREVKSQSVRSCASRYQKQHDPEFHYVLRVDPKDKNKFGFWRLG